MRKVIVAPLNWGLGHASRCIPVIKALQKGQLTPVIASDGAALELLQKEFPKLESIELPSYKISYGKYLKWSLFKDSCHHKNHQKRTESHTSVFRKKQHGSRNYFGQPFWHSFF